MRKAGLMILLVASLVVIGLGVARLARPVQPAGGSTLVVATSADGVALIGVNELAGRLRDAEPPLVWELRSAEAFAESHIPGSMLVAYEQIEMLAATLDHGRPIVTVCA